MKQTPYQIEMMFSVIGEKTYILRHSKRLKITTVANAIGVSHPVISQIENGRYKALSLRLLFRIAEFYEVPIWDLIDPNNNRS